MGLDLLWMESFVVGWSLDWRSFGGSKCEKAALWLIRLLTGGFLVVRSMNGKLCKCLECGWEALWLDLLSVVG